MRFPIFWKHHTLHSYRIQNTPHPPTSEYNHQERTCLAEHYPGPWSGMH